MLVAVLGSIALGLYLSRNRSFTLDEPDLALLFILPAVVGIFLFYYYQIAQTFIYSLHDLDHTTKWTAENFIGLRNFSTVFGDSDFLAALKYTFYFTVVAVFFEFWIGLGMALSTFWVGRRTRWFLRSVIIIPWAIPPIISAAIWKWFFNADVGFGSVLVGAGIIKQMPVVLVEPVRAMHAVILADVWKMSSMMAILLIGGLAIIPNDLYDVQGRRGSSLPPIPQDHAAAAAAHHPGGAALPCDGCAPHLRPHLWPHQGRTWQHDGNVERPCLRVLLRSRPVRHGIGIWRRRVPVDFRAGPVLHQSHPKESEVQRIMKEWRQRNAEKLDRIAAFVVTVIITLFCITPLFWVFSTSLKPMGGEYLMPVQLWPKEPSLQAYRAVLSQLGFLVPLRNSFIVSFFTALLCLGIASLSAYAIARLRFKYKVQSLILLELGAMIPPVVTIAPTFVLLRSLGLLRTLPAMIIPNVFYSIPLATFLLVSYYIDLPFELEDAAKVDGYRPFSIFLRVILPLSAPGLFAVGMFAFIGSYGEFMLASTATLGAQEVQTVPVAIQNFSFAFRQQWTWISAGLILAMIPVVMLVLIFQRWVIKGLTAGSVKS